MTRQELWVRFAEAAVRAGERPAPAGKTADELLAEFDRRFPGNLPAEVIRRLTAPEVHLRWPDDA